MLVHGSTQVEWRRKGLSFGLPTLKIHGAYHMLPWTAGLAKPDRPAPTRYGISVCWRPRLAGVKGRDGGVSHHFRGVVS